MSDDKEVTMDEKEIKRLRSRAYEKAYRERQRLLREAGDPYALELSQRNRDRCNSYYQNNKDAQRNSRNEWYSKNKNEYNEARRKSYLDDSSYHQEYRSRPDVRERAQKRHKERLKNDDDYSIRSRLRGSIKNAVRDLTSSSEAITLLGCSIQEARDYIESQFEPWMNWQNWGRYTKNGPRVWHLDHKIPLSSFNLLLEEERRKAFHHSNLRPLCALENIRKGAKKNYSTHK